jgi:hypothetical protein
MQATGPLLALNPDSPCSFLIVATNFKIIINKALKVLVAIGLLSLDGGSKASSVEATAPQTMVNIEYNVCIMDHHSSRGVLPCV